MKSIDIDKIPKFTKEEVFLILEDAGITKKPQSQRKLLAYIFERWDDEKFGKLSLFDQKVLEECLDELPVQEL